ncbi:S1C family serine protease [Congregicoccus parvus]|uniref:S1C family serine protease n=1 Tax=Congregicoccus parvus TaxID=3081749 RepID=UPI003FA5FED5
MSSRTRLRVAAWVGLLFVSSAMPLAAEFDTIGLYRSASSALVRVVMVEEPGPDGVVTKWAFSGFFVDDTGRVVTNTGSGAPLSRVWIEKDGLSYLAELVGSDPQTNVALVQALKMPENYATLPPDAALPAPPVGSRVLRVALPLELDPTPTSGMVTGYESALPTGVFPFTYTRVDMPAGLGDGGSPVVDATGALVGVTVFSVPDISSSYLVPARALRRIVDDIVATGSVDYGALPLEFAERPDSNNISRNVVVASVVKDSSAARADVRPGDIVRLIGSTSIRRLNDVRDEIFAARPGQFITLEVERDGRRIPFALRVDKRPDKPRVTLPTTPPEAQTATPTGDDTSASTRETQPATPPRLQPPTRPSGTGFLPD